MRLLALAITFTTLTALTAHAAEPTGTRCRSSTIAKVRQQALEDSRTEGRPRAAAALAAYDRLKPALDAGCLSSAHSSSPAARPMNQDAVAYAWLLNDASAYLIAAGDGAPPTISDSAACLDVLQPLLGDDMRPRAGLPHTLDDGLGGSNPRSTLVNHVIYEEHGPIPDFTDQRDGSFVVVTNNTGLVI